MKTYLVLLCGVIPGGKNSIKMAFLREISEEAGFENVKTLYYDIYAREPKPEQM